MQHRSERIPTSLAIVENAGSLGDFLNGADRCRSSYLELKTSLDRREKQHRAILTSIRERNMEDDAAVLAALKFAGPSTVNELGYVIDDVSQKFNMYQPHMSYYPAERVVEGLVAEGCPIDPCEVQRHDGKGGLMMVKAYRLIR